MKNIRHCYCNFGHSG